VLESSTPWSLLKLFGFFLNHHLELSNILDQYHWDLIDRISSLHAENELDKVTKTQKKKFDRLMSKQRPNPKPHPTLENKKTVINRSSKQLSEKATKYPSL
jgi:hypothetical protein